MLQKSANIFEDWIWCSFKGNFCSERKVKGLITKLSVLKVHHITGERGVKVVLKSSSSICAYFIVLVTLGYDYFMHSIKIMRCFHSYPTNLSKTVWATQLLSKMQQLTLLSETLCSLHFGTVHVAVSIHNPTSRLQMKAAVRTAQSMLAEQQFFKQEIGFNQGFPPTFLAGIP